MSGMSQSTTSRSIGVSLRISTASVGRVIACRVRIPKPSRQAVVSWSEKLESSTTMVAALDRFTTAVSRSPSILKPH